MPTEGRRPLTSAAAGTPAAAMAALSTLAPVPSMSMDIRSTEEVTDR